MKNQKAKSKSSKKASKTAGAKAKRAKASKPPKTEPITAEEREKMMAMLQSGRLLLSRIDHEVSNIPDPQKRAQARAHRLAEIDDQLKRWQSEIEQHEDWDDIRLLRSVARFRNDPSLTRLEADLERLKLIYREMDEKGVPQDSLERLKVLFEYESKHWMTYGRRGKSPDAQKDLSVALVLAIKQVTEGRLLRIAQEKGRVLTGQEQNEITQSLWKLIRASFPAIAHEFAPKQFEKYARKLLKSEGKHEKIAKLYLQRWKRTYGLPVTHIKAAIFRPFMKQLDIPESDSRKVRAGIQEYLDKRGFWKPAPQKRRK
jgi:hypothetical protein